MQQYNREHVKHIPILPEKETRDTHTHTHTHTCCTLENSIRPTRIRVELNSKYV